ncbi:MAG: hypothetical protein LBJ61_11410, partial [Deltaproteobacteria bacterium]|nr:hypothetical protein [Deltaproteobacteria bacterium]
MRAEAITEGAQAAPHNPLRERRPFAVPWGYAESLTLALAAMVGGFAAEWLTGPPPLRLIAWPLNLALALIVVALAALARFNRRRAAVKYFTSVPFSVALIAGLGALSLVMGFIPQAAVPYSPPDAPSLGARLGLDHLTSSWPFAVLYSATLLSLGATIAVRFSLKRLIFLANHLGLWLLLLAAGLGAADRLREFMPVREGGLEWRVQHPDGSIAELPLAIRLDSFDVEEYPAKLALIDHETGLPQGTDGRMDFFQLDPLEPKGRLLGYDIELLE